MKNKLKVVVYVAIVVAWFFISQLMAGVLGLSLQLVGMKNIEEHTFLLTLLSYGICMGGLLAIEKGNNSCTYDQYKRCNSKEVLGFVGYGIGLLFLSGIINNLLMPFFPNYNVQISELFDASEPVFRFMVLVIGAPIVEEFIFRGKIQTMLKEEFGIIPSVLIQGLIFGLIHPFGLQKVYATVMGICFGGVREAKNNLWASTVMHMTINCIGWLLGMLTYYMTTTH